MFGIHPAKTVDMKRIAQILLLLLFVSCKEFESLPVAVTSVSLNATFLELEEGERYELTATVNPVNATNKNVTWSSLNPSVASVVDGKVSALNSGMTIITVMTEDGIKTATCEVKVNAKYISVTSLQLDKAYAELIEGEELILTPIVSPENASNKSVVWSSSDPSVASVVDGKVSALKYGITTITAITKSAEKIATCEVKVKTKYPVMAVSLDKIYVELTAGDEITLTATVSPENASNKNVTWSSSDSSVASVTNGNVRALKEGDATIIVWTQEGGKIATCEVNVIKAESGDSNEHVNENEGNW